MNILTIISTSSIPLIFLSVIVYFSRNWLFAWFIKKIHHKYDTQLEHIKAAIKDRENDKGFVNNAALTALSQYNSSILNYRLTAIDNLWHSFLRLKKLSSNVAILATFDIRAISKKSDDPKMQIFIDQIGGSIEDLQRSASDNLAEGEACRIWITQTAWAFYSAYNAIIAYSMVQILILKLNQNLDLVNSKNVVELINLAIPEIHIQTIENVNLPHYLQILESNLVAEFQNQILGYEMEEKNIERANKIVEAAKKITESNKPEHNLMKKTAEIAPAIRNS